MRAWKVTRTTFRTLLWLAMTDHGIHAIAHVGPLYLSLAHPGYARDTITHKYNQYIRVDRYTTPPPPQHERAQNKERSDQPLTTYR